MRQPKNIYRVWYPPGYWSQTFVTKAAATRYAKRTKGEVRKVNRAKRKRSHNTSATKWIKAKAVRVRKVAGRTILDILK